MNRSVRLAGAAALCAALLLGACAKKTDTTTTSTDASSTATAAPDASATAAADATATGAPDGTSTAAPDATATGGASAATATTAAVSTTTAPMTTSANGSSGGSGAYIDLPIYPGATAVKDGSMSVSSDSGSFVVKAYTSNDNPKTVAEWYKAHLPTTFKGGVMTINDKSMGSFTAEHGDGDQSVIVASQDNKTTRIQLATKHGK